MERQREVGAQQPSAVALGLEAVEEVRQEYEMEVLQVHEMALAEVAQPEHGMEPAVEEPLGHAEEPVEAAQLAFAREPEGHGVEQAGAHSMLLTLWGAEGAQISLDPQLMATTESLCRVVVEARSDQQSRRRTLASTVGAEAQHHQASLAVQVRVQRFWSGEPGSMMLVEEGEEAPEELPVLVRAGWEVVLAEEVRWSGQVVLAQVALVVAVLFVEA